MTFKIVQNGNDLFLILSGDFIRCETNREVSYLSRQLNKISKNRIILKEENLGKWDSSLPTILYLLFKKLPNTPFDTSQLSVGLRKLLDLSFTVNKKPKRKNIEKSDFLTRLGDIGLSINKSIKKGFFFLLQILKSFNRWFHNKSVMQSRDFWFALENCGPKAVGIVTLISFMVGLILAFVGALQLKSFGAQIYVASLVSIGMTRIMGAIMVGIIMAGRTGSSYAATIGTMQVNEELDALKTMGISQFDFLILPRILALVISMPFLVILADIMGIIGGGFVGVVLLGLAPEEYIKYSIDAFYLSHFFVGLIHGIVFGLVIAICGCYFGSTCGRDSGSVGQATTKSVVYAIVWMITMTGILTLICEVLGL